MKKDISVVIPFYNEEENVANVLQEIRECQPAAEIIAVDDGSRDETWKIIKSFNDVRGLRFAKNCGQSAAMLAGLKAAKGTICVTMDGDGQNDPADINQLVEGLQTADVVCGYRAKRQDTFNRRLASRIANTIRRFFLHDGVRDTGCSLKAFRKEAVDELIPFNGLHRYLPAFFLNAGLTVSEAPVNHRPRTKGISKYSNWDRALRGIYDLIGVSWYLKRKVHFKTAQNTHE